MTRGRRIARRATLGRMATPPALALLLALAGCAGSRDGTEEAVPLSALACATLDPTSGIWESAPFPSSTSCGRVDAGPDMCCPWLELPGRSIRHVEHGLGSMPRSFTAFIAFDEYGVGASPAAGDTMRVLALDATTASLENRTSQRFFVRFDLE